MFRIDREMLTTAVRRLDHAIYNHNRWYQEVLRTIICRLDFDADDIAEDAYHRCPFGQWYYGCTIPEMHENKTFLSIRTEHERTHTEARNLLLKVTREEPISPVDYDNFADAAEQLRLNLQTLRYEIEETLYNRDPLTGVNNRISMLSDLRKQMGLVDRHVEPTAIAILDIDRFKAVNDTYGHQAGDKVLSNIAAFILRHLRTYDSIYRYGGEEFLIMMPHTDLGTAEAVCERIRIGIGEQHTFCGDEEGIVVTVSIGIARLQAHRDVETAIGQADKALYRAKAHGRNRTIVSKGE